MPDFFSVHIPGDDTEEGNSKRVIVEIVSKPIAKPYIGGFKTKTKGWLEINPFSKAFVHLFFDFKEYHEAFTQTGPVFEAIKWSGITSRDCQAGQKNQSLVNLNELK